jgi:hypothetical protein
MLITHRSPLELATVEKKMAAASIATVMNRAFESEAID